MARRLVMVIATVVLLVLLVLDYAFLVAPAADPRRSTDLIVVLGGLDFDSRLDAARKVARFYPGQTVLISASQASCDFSIPAAAEVSCFGPEPFTTRGEARYVARYATDNGFQVIAVVTTPDQTERARLRFERCFAGDIVMVQAETTTWNVVRQNPYQVAAWGKALFFERSC